MDPTQEQAERLRQMFGGPPGAAQYLQQPNIGNLLGRMGQQGPQMMGPRQYAPQPPPRPPGPQMAGPQLGQATPPPNTGALLGQMAQPLTSPQAPRPDIGGLLGQMGGNVPVNNAPQGPAGAYGGGSPTQQPLSQPKPIAGSVPNMPGAAPPGKPGLPQSPFIQGPPQPLEPPNSLFQQMQARPMNYYQPRQSGRLPLPKGYEGVG